MKNMLVNFKAIWSFYAIWYTLWPLVYFSRFGTYVVPIKKICNSVENRLPYSIRSLFKHRHGETKWLGACHVGVSRGRATWACHVGDPRGHGAKEES
jgi:hypothetical protein